MTLLSKQMYFSKLYRQSQTAYYAADDAISCTTAIDDTYVAADGLGIFPSDPALDAVAAQTYMNNVLQYVNDKNREWDPVSMTYKNPSAPIVTFTGPNAIKCGQSTMLDAAAEFTISPTRYDYYSPSAGIEQGKTVSFKMKMDLGIDPNDPMLLKHLYRCATVTVNKTPSFRQIIAQGYSSCDTLNGGVERAVVNTTVAE
jgi:hypothetical protein